MKKDKFGEASVLWDKLKNGTLSPEEQVKLLLWLNQYKSSSAPHLDEQSFEQAAELINVKLTKEVAVKRRARVAEGRTGLRLLNKRPRMQRVIAAAASVLLIAVGLITIQLWRTSSEFSGLSEDAVSTYDRHPASKRAVLILDNGSQVELHDQLLGRLELGDVTVTHLLDSGLVYLSTDNPLQYADGSAPMNTIYTPRGGEYNFVLPDGTKVFLNSDSRITYPVQFGKTREVYIEGEVFLDVARDTQHPFIVETVLQKLEVLGTSFNVKAYSGSMHHETTLISGKLRASAISRPHQHVTLEPGEFARVNDIQQMEHGKANLSKIMAWKNGDFYFEDETLPEIMETLSRWYDVKVDYAADSGLQERFAGVISRDKKLSAVLAMLESTGKVKFKITEKEVLLMN